MCEMGTRTCALGIPLKIKTTHVVSLLCSETSRFTINKSCQRKEVRWEKIDDSHRGGPRLSRKEITSKIDSILNKHGRFFKGRWKISANRKGTHNTMWDWMPKITRCTHIRHVLGCSVDVSWKFKLSEERGETLVCWWIMWFVFDAT